jgi:hypothetical protein
LQDVDTQAGALVCPHPALFACQNKGLPPCFPEHNVVEDIRDAIREKSALNRVVESLVPSKITWHHPERYGA